MKNSFRRMIRAFLMAVILIVGSIPLVYLQSFADETTEYPLTVKLSVASQEPENGYSVGDEINLWVEVFNPGPQVWSDDFIFWVFDDTHALDNIFYGMPLNFTWVTNKYFTVTSDDMENRQKTFTVTVMDENGQEVFGFATLTVDLTKSRLTVSKEIISEAPEGGYELGDTIEYRITVKNGGNVTISDIAVKDEMTGLDETIASLTRGESTVFTTSHDVTEDDIIAGSVTNKATAKGKDPAGEEVFGEAEIEAPTVKKESTLTVKKTTTSEAPEEGYALGDTIGYSIIVKNEGNVTISDIAVKDEMTGLDETIGSLAPGAGKELTTSHDVTKDDVLAGSVTNIVTVTGKDPEGLEISSSDEVTDDINQTTEDTEPAEPETYKITYVLNGGVYNGSSADIIEMHKDGEVITIHEAPTREGYTFDHWSGSEYQPGEKYTVTGDHVFKAEWKEVKKEEQADDPGRSSDKPDGSPKTGDDTDPALWLFLMLVCAGAIAGVFIAGRKRNKAPSGE